MKKVSASAAAAVAVVTLLLLAQEKPVPWRAVAAGVEHAQIIRDTDAAGNAGPWNVNLVRIDPALARLDVVHALDDAVGLETVKSMAERHGAIAAINGGYFRMTGTFGGDSTGTLQIDGKILSEPDRGRAAVGLVRTGNTARLAMGHVAWEAEVDVAGRKRALNGVNRARGPNDVVVFTPEFHSTTLTDGRGTEVIVRRNRVETIRENAGSSRIPADGFVLSATGTARDWARKQLVPGAHVTVSMKLKPVDPDADNPWSNAEDILGAGPIIVTAGRVDITANRESMAPNFATDRHPRTAIAALTDGRALLATVDGRQPNLSIGMSLDELARLMLEFGAVDAINLDGGGSTTMVVDGSVVNRPSDPTGERPVSDAILVLPKQQ
jgi:exopolysaccharide biosynthesis protein